MTPRNSPRPAWEPVTGEAQHAVGGYAANGSSASSSSSSKWSKGKGLTLPKAGIAGGTARNVGQNLHAVIAELEREFDALNNRYSTLLAASQVLHTAAATAPPRCRLPCLPPTLVTPTHLACGWCAATGRH